MCGIAGFVSRDEHRDPREARAVLERPALLAMKKTVALMLKLKEESVLVR
jgi:hypothetical protein